MLVTAATERGYSAEQMPWTTVHMVMDDFRPLVHLAVKGNSPTELLVIAIYRRILELKCDHFAIHR